MIHIRDVIECGTSDTTHAFFLLLFEHYLLGSLFIFVSMFSFVLFERKIHSFIHSFI